jgi:hypothetical protein
MASIFTHVPHPHIADRKKQGPVVVADQHPTTGPLNRFNAALAVRITKAVGTMWCAYVFALIATTGFPGLLGDGVTKYTLWVSTIFLQLVLLSVIIVGQNVQAAATDARAEQTYEDAEAVLHTALEIQGHLAAQDAAIERILDRIRTL